MGAFSETGKNLMLDAAAGTNPSTEITHAGLLTATDIASVVGEADTEIFTKSGHGLSNGNLVALKAGTLTGGTGLAENTPYYVIGVDGDNFQLSKVSSGSAVNFTTDVSSVTVQKLVEISGGSPAYARKAITFAAASGGSMAASNQPAFDVPAAAVVNYVGLYSADTAGTLQALDDLTAETFGAQGTYTLTGATLSLT